MTDRSAGNVPLLDRLLILLAARLVPGVRRHKWLQYWLGGAKHWWAFLSERGTDPRTARTKLREYSRAAVRDAWKERFPDDSLQNATGKVLRSPVILLGAIVLSLAAFTVVTGGLANTRGAFQPLPYTKPALLFTVTQHFSGFGQLNGVPPATFQMWQSCPASVLDSLAAYGMRQIQLGREGAPDEAVSGMQVSPEFFNVVGVSPWFGRGFLPQDYYAARPVVLSAWVWKTMFHSDMAVVGRPVTVDGQAAVVAGVMPPNFWFVSRRVRVWTLLSRNGSPTGSPASNWKARFIGVVVRLAPGVTTSQAETALGRIARGNRVPWNGAFPELKPMEEMNAPSLYVGAAGVLLTLFLLVMAAILPLGGLSLRAIVGLPFSRVSRFWWFLLAKTILLLTLLVTVWLELMLGIHDPVTGLLSSWVFLLVCVFAAIMILLDQRRRCPVCLHRLSLPVSMGTYSSPLLDPASTELLCDQGHGVLTVPGTETSASAEERWTALDESWRELFTS
jgi:hypothetical protein